jgi:hypothetical protein
VERVLRLLLSAAQRSKWSVLFVVAGAFGLLALLLFGFVSIAGNIILMIAGAQPAMEFLGNGWGIIVTAIISILFMFVGVGILWFLRPHTPQPTPDGEESTSPSPLSKSKALLKKAAARTREVLVEAMDQVLSALTLQEVKAGSLTAATESRNNSHEYRR